MRSGNPVFKMNEFQAAPNPFGAEVQEALSRGAAKERSTTMTVQGTAAKTLLLVAIAIVSAALTWSYFSQNPNMIMVACGASFVLALVAGVVMVKAPQTAWFIAPIFAMIEGAFLAAFSVAVVDFSPLAPAMRSDGMTDKQAETAAMALVGQAAGLTLAIAAGMLLAYMSGLIRLRGVAGKIVIVLTIGVMLYYAAAFLVNMIAGGAVIPQLGWDAGPIGIGFSAVVVVLASLNLVLDFQYVEDGVKNQVPKHYEWVAAFGLLVTLVWLYIEVLRLLAKLRSSD